MAYKFLEFSDQITAEIERELSLTLRSNFWSTGPQVDKLEKKFSSIYSRPAITTSSGGSALDILRLLFPNGKKIAVQANTYFASVLPWVNNNADIVIMSSAGKLLMPDLATVEEALNHSPDLMILTHIGGYPNPYIKEIADMCRLNNVILIEDCAHSPLSKIDQEFVGTFGDAAILSFFPTKPLPAGEGGLILLKDQSLLRKAKQIRNYGKIQIDNDLYHELPTVGNARMNEFSAAILNVLLKHYSKIWNHKKEIADIYDGFLKETSFLSANNEHYVGKITTPSYYKYICFPEAQLKSFSSQVYDLANQIFSILHRNQYPFIEVGTRNVTTHACLPITPSMSSSEAQEIISSSRK